MRNIDVGSYHAGVRNFFFSLLIADNKTSQKGAERISEYSDANVPRTLLHGHRPDGLQNLKAIGLLTWAALAEVLEEAAKATTQDDERTYAQRAIGWLRERGLTKSTA